MMPRSTTGLSDKLQFGIKMEKFEIVEAGLNLPVLGHPKIIKVNIFKDVREQDETIIASYLKNMAPVHMVSQNSGGKVPQYWIKSIFDSLKQLGDGYSCNICGVTYLGAVLKAEAVSHVQDHLAFPGYKCPRSGCMKGNLLDFQEHLQQGNCRSTTMKKVVEGTERKMSTIDAFVKSLLKNLHINTQTAFQFWVTSICQGIKSRNGIFCGFCGEFLGQSLAVSVISHIQDHLPEFPGYSCPRSGCIVKNILSLQKHLSKPICDKVLNKNLNLETRFENRKVRTFLNGTQKTRRKSVKQMSTKILSSLNKHLIATDDTFPEALLRSSTDDLKRATNMDENDPLSISVEEKTRTELESEDSTLFNWQEELDRMENMENDLDSMGSLDELDSREMRERGVEEMGNKIDNPGHLKRKRPLDADISSVDCSPDKPNKVTVPNSPCHKKQKLISCDPDNWVNEVRSRIPLKGKSFICIECGFKANENHPKIAITHVEKFHMNMEEGFKCTKCDLVCDLFMTFNEHMKIAHKVKLSLQKKDEEDEETSFSFVNGCIELLEDDESFDWQEKVQNIFAKNKDIICSVCMFKARDSLGGQKAMVSHIEAAHMENLLGYRCPDCDNLFHAFVEFNQHMNITHNTHMNLLQNRSLFMK